MFKIQSRWSDNRRTYGDVQTFAAPLAIEAARHSLLEAQIHGSQVTHLVTVSCSGFSAPGVDLAIIHKLPLRPNTSRTHIGFMGCHGLKWSTGGQGLC